MVKRAGKHQSLKPEELSRVFSAKLVSSSIRTDAGSVSGVPGQDRAFQAIGFASAMAHGDFNVFVMGEPGSGRHTTVSQVFAEQAAKRPVPGDWIYVNDFEHPHKPVAIEMPAGLAPAFKRAMEVMVDELANDIPALFEAEDYQSQRRKIEQEFGESHERSFAELMKSTEQRGLLLMRTPMGFMVAATKEDRPMKPDEFQALPQKEQDRIDQNIKEAQEELEKVLKQIPKREKEHRHKIEKLNFEVAQKGVEEAIAEVRGEFGKFERLNAYLDEVQSDLIENAEMFLETGPSAHVGAFPVATTKYYKRPEFQRYAVNVIVSNSNGTGDGAPVVSESLPTLSNLVGRIEHRSEMGMLTTDFTLIKPGILHRANGGFIILDIRQILAEPFAWDALKRCLKTREIGIISAQERFSLMTTTSLEPDPIPLDLRVALIGERIWYYLLSALDPEFSELFKVQADFNDDLPATDEAIPAFAGMIKSICEKESLHRPDNEALGELLIEATRLAGDSEKLSLNIGKLSDILREADYLCGQRAHAQISREHIVEAIARSEARSARPRELTQEAIHRNTILIETGGEVVGQINALSVHQIGEFSFGRPSRVTARTRMGKSAIMDIEREVELGGPLHSKGVLILSGFLASHYALDVPLSLQASIVFEQSYGGVDGDSASAAELFALLSSLSDCPIDQSFAVTGSVNQRGEIQAIGGVNQKIEGFFDVCAARGLTGKQGVLIPGANVKHLALRKRVIDAVAEGRFSVVPIGTIEEGLEILTAKAAGSRGKDGRFPAQSVNGRVEQTLRGYAERLQEFAKIGQRENQGK